MPLIGKIQTYEAPISDVTTPTTISLTANTPTNVLAAGNRKGCVVKNTGNGTVTVSWGLSSSKKAYDVDILPGAAYLSDFAEIYPYSAVSVSAGSLSVVELL